MKATTVLLNKSIFSLIHQEQYGIYEDLRDRFHEAQYMVKFELSLGSDNPGKYTLPSSFRDLPRIERDADTRTIELKSDTLCLHEGHRDPRFPLHLAIFEGELEIVKRILSCRPDLASMDALFCAVHHQQVDILSHLIDSLESIPQLRREPTNEARRISFRNFHLIDVATSTGNMEILKMLQDNLVGTASTVALDGAAKAGFLDVVKFLVSSRTEGCTKDAVDNAAMNGHLAVVQFLTECNPQAPCTTNAMDQASSRGKLDVVRFLHFHRTEGCTQNAMDLAARAGHLEIVAFLHTHRNEGCTTNAMDGALSNGHLEIVKFLHYNRTEGCTNGGINGAAFWGHASVLAFAYENRPERGSIDPWIRNIITGNVVVLRMLHQMHGMSGEVDFLVYVDDVQVAEFLYEVDQNMTNIAPGSLPVAQFMRAKGLQFTIDHVNRAAGEGQLDMLQFYHAIDAPFSQETMTYAVSSGNIEVIAFLHTNRDEGCTTEAMDSAVHLHPLENAFQVVEYLHKHISEGCTTSALDDAASMGYLKIVQFLSENRSEGCTTAAMDQAASMGQFEIVKYLHFHRHEGCTTTAMNSAAWNSSLPILQFLADNRNEGCTFRALDISVKLGSIQVVRYLCAVYDKVFQPGEITIDRIQHLLLSLAGSFAYDNSWEAISSMLQELLVRLEREN